MRINKYIAECGVASRRKAEEYIREGIVKVNGTVIKDLGTDIDVDNDIVKVGDVIIKPASGYVYYMLNKPKGYICSVNDESGRKTVLDLMGDVDKRIYPVGRLDYDSEGMLILTNNGDLTYKLTHPKNSINKTYIVKIEGDILESELAVLRAGVVIDGVRYSKCRVEKMDYSNNITKLSMTIHEGKNREIRRAFEAIGKNVIFLKRTQIGTLKMGGLPRGTYKELHEDDIAKLLKNE